MTDGNFDADGVVGGQRELHRTQYDRGMLDLRLQLIKMRTDYLNQINTQSTLLASCAATMLGSSELMALDDNDDMERYIAEGLNASYVVSAAFCLAQAGCVSAAVPSSGCSYLFVRQVWVCFGQCRSCVRLWEPVRLFVREVRGCVWDFCR